MERSTIVHGKTHYFYGHVQVRKLLVYQRVSIVSAYPITAITYPRPYWDVLFENEDL